MMLNPIRMTLFWVVLGIFGLGCELYHLLVIALPCRLSRSYRERFYRRLWNRLIRAWCGTAVRLLQGIAGLDVRVEGRIPKGRHLVVANHQSTAEIVVLVDTLREMNLKFVVKEDLFRRIPNISRTLRSGGFGVVSFAHPLATLRGLRAFSDALPSWDGSPVIYPEGQRTSDGSIAPFRRAGLEMLARETGLPVLPVVIDGLSHARTIRDFFLHLPGSRCRLRFLPPIEAKDVPGPKGLAPLLESRMRAELAEMRREIIEATPSPPKGGTRIGDRLEIAALILSGYACHLYYNIVGHIASLSGIDYGSHLATPLDRAVPYAPAFVLFYQLAYFMPGLVVLLLLARIGPAVHTIRRLVLAFLGLLAVHYAIYLLFPTSAASIRLPDDALGSGILGDLVRYQYRLATPWCAFPSLHVSACWFFYRLIAREYPRLRWIYLVWFLGMLAGTAAIKIHYLLDGATGLILGEVAYRFVLVPLERARAGQWTWRSEMMRILTHSLILALLLAGLPLLMRATGYEGPLYTVRLD